MNKDHCRKPCSLWFGHCISRPVVWRIPFLPQPMHVVQSTSIAMVQSILVPLIPTLTFVFSALLMLYLYRGRLLQCFSRSKTAVYTEIPSDIESASIPAYVSCSLVYIYLHMTAADIYPILCIEWRTPHALIPRQRQQPKTPTHPGSTR